MNSAAPMATRAAITTAIRLERTVPNTRAATPNTGGVLSGNQTLVVKKLHPAVVKAGLASMSRKIRMATISARTNIPPPTTTIRATRSPRPVPPCRNRSWIGISGSRTLIDHPLQRIAGVTRTCHPGEHRACQLRPAAAVWLWLATLAGSGA